MKKKKIEVKEVRVPAIRFRNSLKKELIYPASVQHIMFDEFIVVHNLEMKQMDIVRTDTMQVFKKLYGVDLVYQDGDMVYVETSKNGKQSFDVEKLRAIIKDPNSVQF